LLVLWDKNDDHGTFIPEPLQQSMLAVADVKEMPMKPLFPGDQRLRMAVQNLLKGFF
jgi:hypothetical protein